MLSEYSWGLSVLWSEPTPPAFDPDGALVGAACGLCLKLHRKDERVVLSHISAGQWVKEAGRLVLHLLHLKARVLGYVSNCRTYYASPMECGGESYLKIGICLCFWGCVNKCGNHDLIRTVFIRHYSSFLIDLPIRKSIFVLFIFVSGKFFRFQ